MPREVNRDFVVPFAQLLAAHLRLLFDGREIDYHLGAAAHGAPDDDFALMQFHQFRHDGKPEARAAGVPRARLIRAIKWLEDAKKVFARDADARIFHHERDAFDRGLDGNARAPSARRVGERVFEQVADDLLQCRPGTPHELLRALAERYLYFTFFGERKEFFSRLGDDTREINRREFHAIGAHERRKGEQVVDDFRYAIKLLHIGVQRLLHVGRERSVEERYFGVRFDDRKRGANFMRDVADKLLLRGERVPCRRKREARDDPAEEHRRCDVTIEQAKRDSDKAENDESKAQLYRDHVGFRTEKRIVAIPIQPDDTQRREPFGAR